MNPENPPGYIAVNDPTTLQVVELIHSRTRMGVRRYGRHLYPFNGRDVRRDLQEELADALFYLAQEAQQHDLIERHLHAILKSAHINDAHRLARALLDLLLREREGEHDDEAEAGVPG